VFSVRQELNYCTFSLTSIFKGLIQGTKSYDKSTESKIHDSLILCLLDTFKAFMDWMNPSPKDELMSGVERLLKERIESRDDDKRLLALRGLLSAAGHYFTSNDVSTKLTFHRRTNITAVPGSDEADSTTNKNRFLTKPSVHIATICRTTLTPKAVLKRYGAHLLQKCCSCLSVYCVCNICFSVDLKGEPAERG
jgi:hypothetical protein